MVDDFFLLEGINEKSKAYLVTTVIALDACMYFFVLKSKFFDQAF